MYLVHKGTEPVFIFLNVSFIIATFKMFYIWIYFFQYQSNPKPLRSYEIFSLFMVHLGEQLWSGEVN